MPAPGPCIGMRLARDKKTGPASASQPGRMWIQCLPPYCVLGSTWSLGSFWQVGDVPTVDIV